MCPLFQRVFSNLRHAPAYGEQNEREIQLNFASLQFEIPGELDDAKISLENEKRSLLKRGAHRVVDKKYASSFSLSHCKYKSYEAVDSIFSKKTKAAKISFDENGNETRKHLCSPSVGNSQNWSKGKQTLRHGLCHIVN